MRKQSDSLKSEGNQLNLQLLRSFNIDSAHCFLSENNWLLSCKQGFMLCQCFCSSAGEFLS